MSNKLGAPTHQLVDFIIDDDDNSISSLSGIEFIKVIKSPMQFNATPLFHIENNTEPTLMKIDPVSKKCQYYSELPDIDRDSMFVILNNETEDSAFENVLQIIALKTDDDEEKKNDKKKKKGHQRNQF